MPATSNKEGEEIVEGNPNLDIQASIKAYIENKINKPGQPQISVQVDNKVIEQIFNTFVDIINRHNTYLTNDKLVDTNKLHRIVNNSNLHSMYKIITDAGNLSQSMTSVDGVVEPVHELANKSKKAVDDLFTGAGNFSSQGAMIATNYTGKDCIAKSAATIKTFFKLTHFFNRILNSGDPNKQQLLKIPDSIVKACAGYDPLLAGIRAVDASTIVDMDVLKKLEIALDNRNLSEAGSQLSALLGLSADNAKELVLAKINAGIDLIGLYLYGISIGFETKDLAKILMSDTVEILQKAMTGDIMTGRVPLTSSQIVDYFTNGPTKRLIKFNSFKRTYEVTVDGKKETRKETNKYSPLINMIYSLGSYTAHTASANIKGDVSNIVQKIIKQIGDKQPVNYGLTKLGGAIVSLLKTFDRKTFMSNLQMAYSNTYMKYESIENKQIVMDLYKFLYQYAEQWYDLQSPQNQTNLKVFDVLSIGSQSMQSIGAIVGLNQGIPGDLSKFTKKIQTIENYILDQATLQYRLINGTPHPGFTEDQKKEMEIKLIDFLFNPTYRARKIREAEQYKVNFNLLALIDELPDIHAYVQGLFLPDQYMRLKSARYRIIRDKASEISKSYGIKYENAVEGLSRFIQSAFIRNYLADVTQKGFRFYPKNKWTYGKLKPNSDLNAQGLDSLDGLASFKYWMESEVIPQLKKTASDNQFIRDLKGSSRVNTLSKNEALVYALPGNNMANEDTNEGQLFSKYYSEFHKLNVPYVDSLGNSYDVKRLFFYYTLLAYEWKPAKNSLMNLFKEMKLPYVQDYYRFSAKLDSQDYEYFLSQFADDLPMYIASQNKFVDQNAIYIYQFDQESGQRDLYIKQEEESYLQYGYDEEEQGDWDDGSQYDIDEDPEGNPIDGGFDQAYGYTQIHIADPNYYLFGSNRLQTLVEPKIIQQNYVYEVKIGEDIHRFHVIRGKKGAIKNILYSLNADKEVSIDKEKLEAYKKNGIIYQLDQAEEINYKLLLANIKVNDQEITSDNDKICKI